MGHCQAMPTINWVLSPLDLQETGHCIPRGDTVTEWLYNISLSETLYPLLSTGWTIRMWERSGSVVECRLETEGLQVGASPASLRCVLE